MIRQKRCCRYTKGSKPFGILYNRLDFAVSPMTMALPEAGSFGFTVDITAQKNRR